MIYKLSIRMTCYSPTVSPAPLHSNLLSLWLKVVRVSYRVGGLEFPSPPRNHEIEYGYYCFVTGIKQQSCPRLRQKQSERI